MTSYFTLASSVGYSAHAVPDLTLHARERRLAPDTNTSSPRFHAQTRFSQLTFSTIPSIDACTRFRLSLLLLLASPSTILSRHPSVFSFVLPTRLGGVSKPQRLRHNCLVRNATRREQTMVTCEYISLKCWVQRMEYSILVVRSTGTQRSALTYGAMRHSAASDYQA